MMRADWRNVMAGVALAMLLAGCATGGNKEQAATTGERPGDPDARAFAGRIISLRPLKSMMVITKDERTEDVPFPNPIDVRYDAQTKFFVDGQPATIDQLKPYMPVQVDGHMRDGQMFAEHARFSSAVGVKVNVVSATQP